jgi:hypothetical protein
MTKHRGLVDGTTALYYREVLDSNLRPETRCPG